MFVQRLKGVHDLVSRWGYPCMCCLDVKHVNWASLMLKTTLCSFMFLSCFCNFNIDQENAFARNNHLKWWRPWSAASPDTSLTGLKIPARLLEGLWQNPTLLKMAPSLLLRINNLSYWLLHLDLKKGKRWEKKSNTHAWLKHCPSVNWKRQQLTS